MGKTQFSLFESFSLEGPRVSPPYIILAFLAAAFTHINAHDYTRSQISVIWTIVLSPWTAFLDDFKVQNTNQVCPKSTEHDKQWCHPRGRKRDPRPHRRWLHTYHCGTKPKTVSPTSSKCQPVSVKSL